MLVLQQVVSPDHGSVVSIGSHCGGQSPDMEPQVVRSPEPRPTFNLAGGCSVLHYLAECTARGVIAEGCNAHKRKYCLLESACILFVYSRAGGTVADEPLHGLPNASLTPARHACCSHSSETSQFQ
jgi:hypothetical protein